MEQERKWKGKWNCKPGRTPEELEDERRIEALKMTYTERFEVMRRLMKLGRVLSEAKITHQNPE